MDINVGDNDRYIRLGVGALLALLGIAGYVGMVSVAVVGPQALTSLVLLVIGLVLLVTGYTRKCPLYQALGFDTSE